MDTNKKRGHPAKLEAVRRRFERWRRTHRRRSRIPDALWRTAAKMAGWYGLHRTARALGVEYYSLKRRMEQLPAAVSGRPDSGAAAGFVELLPPVPPGACDCTLELEDAKGAKMRVQLRSTASVDLAALSRSFWNPAS